MKYHKQEEDWQERAYEEQEQCKHNDMEYNQMRVDQLTGSEWFSVDGYEGLWTIKHYKNGVYTIWDSEDTRWVDLSPETIVTVQAVNMRVDEVKHIPVWNEDHIEVPNELNPNNPIQQSIIQSYEQYTKYPEMSVYDPAIHGEKLRKKLKEMNDKYEEEGIYDAVARYREDHPEGEERWNKELNRAMNIKLLTDTPEKAKLFDEAIKKWVEQGKID